MRKHWLALTAFMLLVIAYTILNIFIQPDAESLTRYNMTAASARTLRLTFVVPLIIIWSATMYGYIRFKNYAWSIEHEHDGKALSRIADGILALALWLPLSSLLGMATTYLYHRYPHFTNDIVIVRNYIAIGAILATVYIIWRGTQHLLGAAKVKVSTIKFDKLNALTVALAVIFGYLVLFDPAKNIPPTTTGVAAYYLPNWLLILTVIIPYGFIWFYGIRAVANLHLYRKRVKGIIYKSALGYLAKGIGVSIVCLLLLRYLGSMTAWLNSLALKPLLGLLYLLIFVIGIGSILLAAGAKKLQKIEEV